MINYNELQKGSQILLEKQPYEITESSTMFKGRGHSTLQAKLKNLITGEILSKTFHPSDSFEEAEVEKIDVKFLYSHRDKFVFCKPDSSSNRFELDEKIVGDSAKFLKPNTLITGIVFNKEIINITPSIKIELKVTEAPPGTKGDRAQGGNKLVTLETGNKVNVPLFIQEGDIIEINTGKNEYVRRVK